MRLALADRESDQSALLGDSLVNAFLRMACGDMDYRLRPILERYSDQQLGVIANFLVEMSRLDPYPVPEKDPARNALQLFWGQFLPPDHAQHGRTAGRVLRLVGVNARCFLYGAALLSLRTNGSSCRAMSMKSACPAQGRCEAAMSRTDLLARLEGNRMCAIARDRINKTCFAGGDRIHRDAAIDAWNGLCCTKTVARADSSVHD